MPVLRFARRAGCALAGAVLALSIASFGAVVAAQSTERTEPRSGTGSALDIDTADAATLAERLPGIGPVKARRIVEYRERHGPFGGLDALEAVKGIGPATIERIRAHLLGTSASDPSVPRPLDGGGGTSSGGARSTSELERATRAAVRRIVDEAHRDTVRVR